MKQLILKQARKNNVGGMKYDYYFDNDGFNIICVEKRAYSLNIPSPVIREKYAYFCEANDLPIYLPTATECLKQANLFIKSLNEANNEKP